MEKKRNVNIELLRSLSMMMVVILHCLRHGGILNAFPIGSVGYYLFWGIESISFFSVNVFVIITGYFSIDKPFKPSKILRIWFQLLFYSFIGIVIVFMINGTVDSEAIKKLFLPITTNVYWFATAYIVLLCIAPILNSAASKFSQKEYLIVLAILSFVFSIVPTFFYWSKSLLTLGNDYSWFLVLYLTGGYLRKYPSSKRRKTLMEIIIVCTLLLLASRYILDYLLIRMGLDESGAKLFYYYNSPIVYLGSIAAFCLFLTITIKNQALSNIILKIGKLVFGIYLLHDSDIVRDTIWGYLSIDQFAKVGGVVETLGVLVVTVIVFSIAGCVVEIVRQRLEKSITSVIKIDRIDKWIDSFLKEREGLT